jgi:acetyltransferase
MKAAFERLGEDSRYQRFLSPMGRLTDEQIGYLTRVDQRDHVALIAVDEAHPDSIVGVARFVRLEERVAEPAITVADEWQRLGVGTTLLAALTARARDEGIQSYRALVLAGNDDALRLLRTVGDLRQRTAGAEVQVEVSLEQALVSGGGGSTGGRRRSGATM